MQVVLRARRVVAVGAGVALALVPAVAGHAAPAGATVLVSQTPDGTQGDKNSNSPAITPDGRFVAFGSNATNLVPGDTNGVYDLFVRDLKTGALDLISAAPDGSPADGGSYESRISADGRYVTFYSAATNLVAGDDNSVDDVFFHDRQTGKTTRLPAGPEGALFPDISANGRFVVYSTRSALAPGDLDVLDDIYLWDRTTGEASLLTGGNGVSFEPRISGNGRWVTFKSNATDLTGDPVDGNYQVFLYDRSTATNTLVSKSSAGEPGTGASASANLSDNGRYIAFTSTSGNLVPGDSNGETDIFLHDRANGRTTVVSAGPGGVPADGASYDPDVSADGRYVGFISFAQNLTGEALPSWDVHSYLHDRETGRNTAVSVPANGTGSGGGWSASVSSGGRFVAFESDGTDLVDGDDNGEGDVFVSQLY